MPTRSGKAVVEVGVGREEDGVGAAKGGGSGGNSAHWIQSLLSNLEQEHVRGDSLMNGRHMAG